MALAWPDISALGYTTSLPLAQGVGSIIYQSVDNMGSVTFGFGALITSPVRIRERQISFGVYKYWETTFKIDPNIWNAVAPFGRIPKPRDLITDRNNNQWRVARAVGTGDYGTIWRLVCNRLVVESLLADQISIKKPVDTTDAYLSPLTAQGNPSGPETNIPCRIQFDREAVEDFQGIQFFRGFYKIYVQNLDDNLAVGAVVTATAGAYNGMTFRVVSNDNIEELEELEVLTVTIDPVA